MPFTMIHDSVTTSLELELSDATASRIEAIHYTDTDSKKTTFQGRKDKTKWEFLHGSKSKKSHVYYCHLRHANSPGKVFSKKHDHWYTTICYVVERKSNRVVLRIKANPTAISLQRSATAKSKDNNETLFTNSLDFLEHIYREFMRNPNAKLWNAAERKRIDNLELYIADVEVAIPFECDASKHDVLRVLNAVYDTSHVLNDKKFSISKELNLRVETYTPKASVVMDTDLNTPISKSDKARLMKDNDFIQGDYTGDDNIRFASYRGTNHQFSLTFYDKITEMEAKKHVINKEDRKTWDKYLRMDIRMSRSFLEWQTKIVQPTLKDWMAWADSKSFQKILDYILIEKLRLFDLIIQDVDLIELSRQIKKLSPEFHELWLDSMAIKSGDSYEYKSYAKLCKPYGIKPTTGGKLLHMAVRTGMLESVTEKEFLYSEDFVTKLFKKPKKGENIEPTGMAKTKYAIGTTLDIICPV